jgi:hypothetical protein
MREIRKFREKIKCLEVNGDDPNIIFHGIFPLENTMKN